MAIKVPLSLSPLSNFANLIDNAFYDIPFVSNPMKKTSGKKDSGVTLGATTTRSAAPTGGSIATFDTADDGGYVASANTGAGGSGYSAEEAAEAKRQAEVAGLRGEIGGRGGELISLLESMFGDLDNLIRDRDSQLESEYGEQFKKASDTYTSAIPQISNSYAAIGAGDSTDKSDAKDSAKKGFDDTNATIKKNKDTDKAKLGQYKNEQRTKIEVDRDNARRNVERANTTDDVEGLRGMRNDLESGIGNARVTKATLGTDGQARRDVSALTADNGRFSQAQNALDSIIKSSMSGAVKEAAVKSIVDNAGLTDEEKQKVQLQYGNVYNEQNLA